MGDIASYRLVYFQPDPEDGERVCVALLFSSREGIDLLSYPDSPRLRCLAPHIDPDLVQIYLLDLKTRIQEHQDHTIDFSVSYSPQLAVSEARKVTWPLTDKSRLYLMKRFLAVSGAPSSIAEPLKAEKAPDQVKEHLKQLIVSSPIRTEELKENATPSWVFGTKIKRGIKPLAFGLRKRNGVVLIDGVDLSLKNVAARVGKVAYAFFQYDRVRQMGFADRQVLRRVGVILNGAINPAPDYTDSHDFAFREFNEAADLTVDASSAKSLKEFYDLLSSE